MRVLNTEIQPGERTPVHVHQWPAVHYVLSWSDFVRRDANDKVMIDTRDLAKKPDASTALWGDPLAPHTLENGDTAPLRSNRSPIRRPPVNRQPRWIHLRPEVSEKSGRVVGHGAVSTQRSCLARPQGTQYTVYTSVAEPFPCAVEKLGQARPSLQEGRPATTDGLEISSSEQSGG